MITLPVPIGHNNHASILIPVVNSAKHNRFTEKTMKNPKSLGISAVGSFPHKDGKLITEQLYQILDIMLEEVMDRLTDQLMTLKVGKKAKDYLIDKGYDVKFGARPLRRIIQKEIEDQLSMEILKGRFVPGDTINLTVSGDKLVFKKSEKKV